MRLSQLHYLQAVLEAGSFRAAARKLGVSQPTLSQQIKLLEEELDVSLLNRTSSKTVATAEISTLLPHVTRILQEEQYLVDQAGAVRGLRVGNVRLGSITILSQTILADALPEFRRAYPSVKFSVWEGPSGIIAERVRSGEIDLGLIAVAPDEPLEQGLVYSDLFTDRTVLCAPHDFVLPKKSKFRIADFADSPWIIQGEGYARHRMLTRLAAGANLNVVYESTNPNTTLRLVASGVGIALVSEISFSTGDAADLKRIRLLPISAPDLKLSMVSRKDTMPPPAIRELRGFLLDSVSRVAPHRAKSK